MRPMISDGHLLSTSGHTGRTRASAGSIPQQSGAEKRLEIYKRKVQQLLMPLSNHRKVWFEQ